MVQNRRIGKMISPDALKTTQKKTSLVCHKSKNLKIQMSYNPLRKLCLKFHAILTTGGSFGTNGLRTEKLSFARICYVKDRKAMLCKNLLCEGEKSNDLQEFAM